MKERMAAYILSACLLKTYLKVSVNKFNNISMTFPKLLGFEKRCLKKQFF